MLLSALEPLADGGARVRLWNASDEARPVRVRLAGAPGPLRAVDLRDEPVGGGGDPGGKTEPGTLWLRPWQIATLRCRAGG